MCCNPVRAIVSQTSTVLYAGDSLCPGKVGHGIIAEENDNHYPILELRLLEHIGRNEERQIAVRFIQILHETRSTVLMLPFICRKHRHEQNATRPIFAMLGVAYRWHPEVTIYNTVTPPSMFRMSQTNNV
jgi:hypothetical protein